MGVKSTKYLTRGEAEYKFLDFVFDGWNINERIDLSNEELADILEILNDSRNDGEGFENYIIQEATPTVEYVTYAHKSSPDGLRYRGFKGGKHPSWAVNFKDDK